MTTIAEIEQRYIDQHRELEERYYKRHELEKEEFDRRHGELWESYQQEMVATGFAQAVEPERDLALELDELKGRVEALEQRGVGP